MSQPARSGSRRFADYRNLPRVGGTEMTQPCEDVFDP